MGQQLYPFSRCHSTSPVPVIGHREQILRPAVPNVRNSPRVLGTYERRIVGRRVIGDDNLHRSIGLRQGALQCLTQERSAVAYWHGDGKLGKRHRVLPSAGSALEAFLTPALESALWPWHAGTQATPRVSPAAR